MKFRFQFSRVNYRRIDCNNCVGTITMGAVGTRRRGRHQAGVSGTTGSSYAGIPCWKPPATARSSYGADIDFIFQYYAWYFQDDIKINNRLTLNVGYTTRGVPETEGTARTAISTPHVPIRRWRASRSPRVAGDGPAQRQR